jgi:hypothetical protein
MQGVRSQIDLLEMWFVTRGKFTDPVPPLEDPPPTLEELEAGRD